MNRSSEGESPVSGHGVCCRLIFVSLLVLTTAGFVLSAILIGHHLTYKRRVLESTRARLTSLDILRHVTAAWASIPFVRAMPGNPIF